MRSCWQKRLSQLRTGVHDVFAVVQHDQGMAPGKMSREFLDHGAGADVPHAQSFRRRADHGLRVQYGCQVHQPHPVRKAWPTAVAASNASPVLPIPPGPVSVRSLAARRRRRISAVSRRRPMKVVRRRGQVPRP
ncbi:hypothetical protein GCM10017771_46170 [Streptomyces capitiformicae]|uniref:Uncharacterized protein n=1 Tax=Streptomyces capitiformicae TaxID=2014920 RepID=A0A918Z1U7_9ACTN|nr:hypothetical protein GCM10017771_46170 [Streptomyces capitiformicae]